jgi:hypothetical protein
MSAHREILLSVDTARLMAPSPSKHEAVCRILIAVRLSHQGVGSAD